MPWGENRVIRLGSALAAFSGIWHLEILSCNRNHSVCHKVLYRGLKLWDSRSTTTRARAFQGVTRDASPLILIRRREIMDWPGVRNYEWLLLRSRKESIVMNDFNRKVEEATARLNKSVAEFTATLEQETAELVKYLNDEIVPDARQHSTKALRLASEKLARLADYMDSAKGQRK